MENGKGVPVINYKRLGKSTDYYENLGYKRIEAPWWVPTEIIQITAPAEHSTLDKRYYLPLNKKELVASGEQSFLYLANQGLLSEGKYQTITPCFRDEVQGPLRRKFFMKNELIIIGDQSEESLKKIIDDAFNFFLTEVPDSTLLKVVKTESGYDIEYNGIEIGSYGIRSCSFVSWIYGTGLAEPRFGRAIKS